MSKFYYVRHVHDWPSNNIVGSTIEYLYNHKAIAIHFAPEESWALSDYKGKGRTEVDYMNRCNEGEDCHVFASYRFGGADRILRGTPKRDSKQFLKQLTGAVEDIPLKVLLLENTFDVSLMDFPYAHLLASKLQTFVRWHACERIANSFINGEPLNPQEPDSYLPWALEVMCDEYLRLRGFLKLKLYACGETLKHFDIIGIDGNGARVFSQVKNRASLHQINSFARERSPGSSDKYIFFCKQICIPNDSPENCNVISLEEVLETLHDSCGESYLRKLMTASF